MVKSFYPFSMKNNNQKFLYFLILIKKLSFPSQKTSPSDVSIFCIKYITVFRLCNNWRKTPMAFYKERYQIIVVTSINDCMNLFYLLSHIHPNNRGILRVTNHWHNICQCILFFSGVYYTANLQKLHFS